MNETIKLSLYLSSFQFLHKSSHGFINSHCGFFKSAFYRESLCFFVTFNIVMTYCSWKHDWNSSSNSFRTYEDFVRQYYLLLSIFWIFWHFLVTNKLMTTKCNRWYQHFSYIQRAWNKLINSFIKLYWFWISSSWNMKGRRGQIDPPHKKLL